MQMSMECNKDEALRSRYLAEQKFLLHDIMGAKKFALKAQCLFPDLEGLPQLIAILDVHSVAQQKVDGVEMNWYGILQTDARADEATIRKQYRKLALILHPDKNKAIGAEGAFKLISEAWRVLSDKEKKAAHDAKRMVKSNNCPGFPATRPTKGFCNFTHFSAWCQPRPGDKKSSFWTACPSCKMQFEYLRAHENKKISCPTCGKFFMACEIRASGYTSSPLPSDHVVKEAASEIRASGTSCSKKQLHTDKGSSVPVGSSFSSHWGNRKYTAVNQATAAETTARMVQETYEAVRRERVKAQKEAREKAAMERMEAEKKARRREHQDRKQKRKQEQLERLAKVTTHANGSFEKGSAMESMHVNDSESTRAGSVPEMVESSSRRAGSVGFMPTEDVESGMERMSRHDSTNGSKELGLHSRERVARMDHVQEPFWCIIRNTFDSSNSYDSSDVFHFSKRLKVDV